MWQIPPTAKLRQIVCGPSRRHTTLFHRENRYANLRANPSNLAHPSCSPCNGSTGGWHIPPSTPSPPPSFALLIHPISFSPLSLFLSRLLGCRTASLHHSVCDAHFSSENTFFPSRRVPVARRGCDRGLTGVDG